MKHPRCLRLLLLGIALLSAIASTTLLIEKHRIERSASALSARHTSLKTRLNEKRLRLSSPPAHATDKSPSPVNSSAFSAHPAPSSPSPPTTPSPDPLAEELALQTLQLISKRAAFPTRYAPFLRSQPLSLPQLTALEELLSHRDEQRLDLAAVIRSHRLAASDPAIARLRAQTEHKFRQNLIQLIGAQPAETLVEFERKLPAWELVGNFAGTAALEGQPITPDQATELAEVIATASPSYQAGNDVSPADVNWPAVIPRAVALLTPPQALSFRNMPPRYPIENPTAPDAR